VPCEGTLWRSSGNSAITKKPCWWSTNHPHSKLTKMSPRQKATPLA
jgi:hypothetical protein